MNLEATDHGVAMNSRLLNGTFDAARDTYQRYTAKIVPDVVGNPWTPLFMNICVPGSGTIYAVMYQKNDSRFINVLFGLFQFCTWFILLGWICGVIWGLAIAERSWRYAHHKIEKGQEKPEKHPDKHQDLLNDHVTDRVVKKHPHAK
jgi:hypothetical protein